jgi:hypothetical protein
VLEDLARHDSRLAPGLMAFGALGRREHQHVRDRVRERSQLAWWRSAAVGFALAGLCRLLSAC